ncbi:hypothetical protein ACFQY7_36350 [Actinomadura luteofluorescens]
MRTLLRGAGRLGYLLGLPAVLLTLWWVLTASSTDFYFPRCGPS